MIQIRFKKLSKNDAKSEQNHVKHHMFTKTFNLHKSSTKTKLRTNLLNSQF